VNQPPIKRKPVSEMTKLEMEAAIKSYRFVLVKLHKEIADKDEEIRFLTKQLERKRQNEG
jgi:hypothetical protein